MRHAVVAILGLLSGCASQGDLLSTDRPPLDTLITEAPPELTSHDTASFRFVATRVGATFACRLDDQPVSCDAGQAQLAGLAEGPHRFTVAAVVDGVTDATPAEHRWTIDHTPPYVSVSVDWRPTNDNQADVMVSVEAGASVELYVGPLCAGAPVATGSGDTRAFVIAVPDDSRTRFSAIAVDAVGNRSPCAASSSAYIEDSTPPSLRVTEAPAPLLIGGQGGLELRYAIDEPLPVSAIVDGELSLYCDRGHCGSQYAYVAPGDHTVILEAQDEAGNVARVLLRVRRLVGGATMALGLDFSGSQAEGSAGTLLRDRLRAAGRGRVIVFTGGGATVDELAGIQRALAAEPAFIVTEVADPAGLAAVLRGDAVLLIPDQNVVAGDASLRALADAWSAVIPSWVALGLHVIALSGRTPDGAVSGSHTLLGLLGLLDTSGGAEAVSGTLDGYTLPPGAVAFLDPGDSPTRGVAEIAEGPRALVRLRRTVATLDFSVLDLGAAWPWSPWSSLDGRAGVASGDGLRGPAAFVAVDALPGLDGPYEEARTLARVTLAEESALRLTLDATHGVALSGGPAGCALRIVQDGVTVEAPASACGGPLVLGVRGGYYGPLDATLFDPAGRVVAHVAAARGETPTGPLRVDLDGAATLHGLTVDGVEYRP